MTSRAWVYAIAGAALLGLLVGVVGCGESCEDFATTKCEPFFNDDAGDGAKYDICYRQALAECGYTP